MIEIDRVAFVFICILAGVGAIILALIFVYIVAGILDLTYHQRHKEKDNNCPDYIDREDNDK